MSVSAPEPQAQPAVASVAPLAWGWREWLLAALLVGLAAVTLSPVLQGDFLSYDDREYVTENPHVKAGLTRAGLSWGLTMTRVGNWHPLVWWSLMLDAQLYGPANARGFHLTNLLWHLGSVLLLFAALRRLTRSVWASALAAAVFAVHPLNVEPVAWVAERKGVLSTFFWMLALWAYARYAEQPSLRRYLLVAVALLLGLLAKPMLVTLPFVLLLLDFWPLGRLRFAGTGQGTSWRRLVLEKVPLLAIAAVFAVVAVLSQNKAGAFATLETLSLGSRLQNATTSYVIYLGRAFWPTRLAAYYPIQELPAWEVAGAAILLLGISAAVVWQLRRVPHLAVGWFWFLGTLVPVIGLVQLGSSAQADRYAYVPLVGLIVAVCWSLVRLAQRWHCPRPAAGFAALMVGCLALLSWRQTHVWRNTTALWEHALAVTANNHVAHNNLAIEFQKRGDGLMAARKLPEALACFQEALRHFEEALRIKPGYALALNGKGRCLMAARKLPEALACFQEAVQSDPTLTLSHNNLGVALALSGRSAEAVEEFSAVVHLDPQDAFGHLNLGRALLSQGRAEEAIRHFLTGRRLNPGSISALPELGRAYQLRGEWQQAEACFSQLVNLHPEVAAYRRDLALCLVHLRQPRQATAQYRVSLQLDPNWPSACLTRAWLLSTHPQPASRRGSLALLLAQQVVQVSGGRDARSLDTLACAYAEVGDFSEALRVGRTARARASAAGQKALLREIDTRLRLYEKGQPFHRSL